MDLLWYKEELTWFCRKVAKKLVGYRYPKKLFKNEKTRDIEEAGQLLREYIMSDQPFALCRFGTSELKSFVFYKRDKKYGTNFMKKRYKVFEMFSNNEVDRYMNLIESDTKDVDIAVHMLGIGISMEEWVYATYLSSSEIMEDTVFNFYDQKTPWTFALENKKVLVVNPFAETIQSQYKKRKYLFANEKVLPEMELETIKAVWYTSKGEENFPSWFDALDYMFEEIMKKDFDVALLGCGTFGFHLATMIKRAGKKAIHLGGITQLLFGIKGNRWDEIPEISQLYNEYWVRPDSGEKPKNIDMLDKGCYW